MKGVKKYEKDMIIKQQYNLEAKEYGRLIHLVDSNQKKWRKYKVNHQIIGKYEYYFIYIKYNDIIIVEKRRIEDEY